MSLAYSLDQLRNLQNYLPEYDYEGSALPIKERKPRKPLNVAQQIERARNLEYARQVRAQNLALERMKAAKAAKAKANPRVRLTEKAQLLKAQKAAQEAQAAAQKAQKAAQAAQARVREPFSKSYKERFLAANKRLLAKKLAPRVKKQAKKVVALEQSMMKNIKKLSKKVADLIRKDKPLHRRLRGRGYQSEPDQLREMNELNEHMPMNEMEDEEYAYEFDET